MEGPIEEDSIAETNVISKAASTVVSAAQIIKTANGQTVVLTGGPSNAVSTLSTAPSANGSSSPSPHHPNANKSVPTVAQAIAVPGGMSIVQLLPNQTSNMVQSVIQPNHQSVIQAPNTTSIPLLNNKLILVNNSKLGQGSVIQSTESEHSIQVRMDGGHHFALTSDRSLQLAKEESDAVNQAIFEEESKRRREILARRPSYRKILNDLAAGTETDKSDDEHDTPQQTIQLPAGYLKVLPAGSILSSQDGSTIQGISTIMTNANSSSTGSTIVQYATSGHDGFIVPADLQTYQLRPPNPSGLAQNVVMTSSSLTPQIIDEASKKRELRLLKNREAAKECRRKKKEYIKCLENRVAVLENQNKALIDELKTLKELYCKKSE